MEENNKGGFTAEGRKLRPRRPRISSKVYSSTDGPSERRSYGHSESRSYGRSEGRSYGYSENRSYGPSENRSYGNSGRRSYGQQENRGYSSDNHRRSYSHSEGRSYDSDHYRSQGGYSSGYGRSESRGYGQPQGRSYNPESRGSYGNNSGRSFGPSGRRAWGSGESRGPARGEGYDEYRSFEDRSQGQERRHPSGRGVARPFGPSGRRSSFQERPEGKPTPRKGAPKGKPGFQSKGAAGKPSRGNAKKTNMYFFNEADEQNINIMLSRKPQLDQMQMSDNDYVPTPVKDVIRLNKFIANSGICSRREADQYIQAGVVTVNGEVVSELGAKVNLFTDDIRFNGQRLKGEEKVYIVMNKPKGFVTTASDPHADKTVMDLLKNCSARVFPVGRLDKNTTGVLMFTNDGETAEKLTHPSYDKKKIYQVLLDKPITEEDFGKVVAGVELSDGMIAADELEYIDAADHRKLGIEIHSGKNRIVRRIFEAVGYEVKALDRVYFAGLTKKGLKKGEWRYLSEGEANILKMGSYV